MKTLDQFLNEKENKGLDVEQRIKFTEVLQEYRKVSHLSENDEIITGKGETGLFVSVKGGRMTIKDKEGNLKFSSANKPESIGKFVEQFWFWNKGG